MKTLILFRHAKSSWENYSSDKEREILTIGKERAIKSAIFLQRFLQKNSISVDRFISSEAIRARQTAKITTEVFNTNFEVSNALYTFSVIDLEKVIHSFSNDDNVIVIFGHNNAFTDFINKYGTVFIENLPTSGVAIIHFKINSWKNLVTGTTEFTIFPKLLP